MSFRLSRAPFAPTAQVLYTMRLYSTGHLSKDQESATPATAIAEGAVTAGVPAGSGSPSPLTAWWPLWDPGNSGEGSGDEKVTSTKKEVKVRTGCTVQHTLQGEWAVRMRDKYHAR